MMLKSLSPEEHAECETSRRPRLLGVFQALRGRKECHVKILCEKTSKWWKQKEMGDER